MRQIHFHSGLLSQLKRDGFKPSDPTLFDSIISSLSCSISNQMQTASALSDFIVSKRHESYLGRASLPLSAAQKRELLISPGSGSDLFDQELIEKVSGQVKEDSFVSSSSSLAKLARSQSQGRGKSSMSSGAAGSSRAPGSSIYSSPLDYSRSCSFSSGKRSSSPGRGGGGKRFKGGRGAASSPKSKWGFHK